MAEFRLLTCLRQLLASRWTIESWL